MNRCVWTQCLLHPFRGLNYQGARKQSPVLPTHAHIDTMLRYTHKEHMQQTFMRALQKRKAINAIVFLETNSQLRFPADEKRREMKGHKKHTHTHTHTHSIRRQWAKTVERFGWNKIENKRLKWRAWKLISSWEILTGRYETMIERCWFEFAGVLL